MARREPIEIVATGVRLWEEPDPERALRERFGVSRLTPEERAAIAAWREGRCAFVWAAGFVELRRAGEPDRWDDTPQGPFPVSRVEPATSALLEAADQARYSGSPDGDLGIAGFAFTRFAFAAAPMRIELDDALAARLVLD